MNYLKEMGEKHNITETGKNLSVLIITETGKDWETFATWYSVFKNLPDATVAIICLRNDETPFRMFQWAKRLDIHLSYANPLDSRLEMIRLLDSQKSETSLKDRLEMVRLLDATRTAFARNLIGENVLVITPLVMATEVLDSKLLHLLNNNDLLFGYDVMFLRNASVDNILNGIFLEDDIPPVHRFCSEANQTEEAASLVSYKKGCGKWIDKLKGCPFANAAGLVSTDMTVNENRIVNLWKRMCSLYSAVV